MSGEVLIDSIQREITEETGIPSEDYEIRDIGEMIWFVNEEYLGGMHLFFAKLPDDYDYPTPRAMEEGILDFKQCDWIFDQENTGVVSYLSYIFQHVQNDSERIKITTKYHGTTLLHISHESL